ncbi:MAG: hypothetical protein AAF702_37710 [Chloroflexota bacterium]
MREACHLVAETFYGEQGRWLYAAFDAINAAWFEGALPYPHLILSLTAHGRCLGQCAASDRHPPTMIMHPSVFGGTAAKEPWGVPSEWLGQSFAFDVLLHECIHASVHYHLGGMTGTTSHNDPQWITEVNRLAPLLGFEGIEAGRSTTKRVPVDGPLSKRGKRPTGVKRVTEGNIPFEAVATFPYGLRRYLGIAEAYYKDGVLPIVLRDR